MSTFVMLTRLNPEAVRSPRGLEELEREAMKRVREECPDVKWLSSYAVLGPCDYLDIFIATDIETAAKGSSDNSWIGSGRQRGRGDSPRSWRVVVLGMIDEDSLQKLRKRNAAILPQLDERQRRLFAASEARAAGHGGIAAVSRMTHIAASTIGRGLKELDSPPVSMPGRVRRPGGGRKSLTETNPGLLDDLNALVAPEARGDPMSPLRWTCKSLRRLADELSKLGHKVSHTVVGELLKKQKFSLQANSRIREGADNPDRDAQFRVINEAVKTAIGENQPAISVDTKKKELVGDFKNAGREWRKQGDP
ncbi:MAG TPA: ISAzo13 family transposase, partial [Isosphaeraceae bacterium]|nr:ISAzo13 family transposase [Isosphaeraceae bacterium]